VSRFFKQWVKQSEIHVCVCVCVCVCGWNEFFIDNNSEVWLVLISNKEAIGRLVDPTGPVLQMS
jgi:hypothetical protein